VDSPGRGISGGVTRHLLAFSGQRLLAFKNANGSEAVHTALSTDKGASFSAPEVSPILGNVRHTVTLSSTAGLVFAVGGSPSRTRVWRTGDAGATWTGGDEITHFQTLIELPQQVVMLVAQQTILRTADGGLTWQTVHSVPFGMGFLSTVISLGGGRVQIVSNKERLVSEDDGATWGAIPEINSPLRNGTAVVIPDGPALVKINSGWYRSVASYPYDAFSEFQVPHLVDVTAPLGAYVKGR